MRIPRRCWNHRCLGRPRDRGRPEELMGSRQSKSRRPRPPPRSLGFYLWFPIHGAACPPTRRATDRTGSSATGFCAPSNWQTTVAAGAATLRGWKPGQPITTERSTGWRYWRPAGAGILARTASRTSCSKCRSVQPARRVGGICRVEGFTGITGKKRRSTSCARESVTSGCRRTAAGSSFDLQGVSIF